jgi:mutator protein MutT
VSANSSVLVVVAAVIEEDGSFLLSRRLKGTHLEGLWEFPGGKCEPGETRETALARELMEELGVGATIGAEIFTVEHAYTERTVRLHFHRCQIHGRPAPLLKQELRWAAREELAGLPFPAADADLIRLLTTSREA